MDFYFTQSQLDDIHSIFRSLDTDNDSFLIPTDLPTTLDTLGKAATDEKCTELVMKHGKVKPGMVNFNEFQDLLLDHFSSYDDEVVMNDFFHILDSKDDGIVDAEEFLELLEDVGGGPLMDVVKHLDLDLTKEQVVNLLKSK